MITKERFVLALLSVVSLCFATVQILKFSFNRQVVITQNVATDVSNVTSLRSLLTTATGVAINAKSFAVVANASFDDEQANRQKTLSKVCARLGFANTTVPDHWHHNMFAEARLQYFYCMVPKAACSSWKRVLARANGLPATKDVNLHLASEAHRYVPPLLSFPSKRRKEIWRNHFKFMFVRHPFERLVSAFRNKFREQKLHKPNSRYSAANKFIRLAEHIKKRYRRKAGDVGFRDFVSYVLDTWSRGKEPLDQHWRPMHQLCEPCLIRYDFIGHYETLDTDSSIVMSRLGIPSHIQFPTVNAGKVVKHRTNSSTMVRRFMGTLKPGQIQKLKKLYRLDFELFGYSYRY